MGGVPAGQGEEWRWMERLFVSIGLKFGIATLVVVLICISTGIVVMYWNSVTLICSPPNGADVVSGSKVAIASGEVYDED